MARALLHVFAVNAQIDVRHTFLSRSTGQTTTLPDLAGWLSLRQGGLDTDNIELFPVDDLGDLRLADYIATAFDPLDAALKTAAPKLNALDGHVLLVPQAALAGDWTAGADLTLVDSLPLAVADHVAEPLETEAATYGQPSQDHIGWHQKTTGRRHKAFGAFAVFIVLVCVLLILAAMG